MPTGFARRIYRLHLHHRHPVFRQRTSLVRTDTRHGTHRLRGLQLTHEVVRFQHPPHVQRQGQRDGHRQTLGHSHHDKRHSHHKVLQHHFRHADIVRRVPQLVAQDVVHQEHYECCCRQANTHLADQLGQAVQLDVQRSLHTRYLR